MVVASEVVGFAPTQSLGVRKIHSCREGEEKLERTHIENRGNHIF
jgi:hypothetical protein